MSYCGDCCWFYCEQSDGEGFCILRKGEYADIVGCDVKCTEVFDSSQFVSREEMRHHIAVLIQANRYRRDRHVPSIYGMPNPIELGKAIDFSVKFLKSFGKL